MNALEKIYTNSLLEKQYFSLLEDKKIQVVSFDIFDTLVFRKSGSPESIFDIMGKSKRVLDFFEHESNFKPYRMQAEKNARLKSKYQEITLEEIYSELPLPKKAQKELLNIELSSENEMLCINAQTQRWVDFAHSLGKKIVLISDMYLSDKQIRKLVLSKMANQNKISHFFLSSKLKKTKASGNLFLHVQERLKVEFEEILHIGDNERSDIAIPQGFGIKTLHYGVQKNEKDSLKNEATFMKQNSITGLHVRNLSILQNPYKKDFQRFYYFLGSAIFAPLLWEFSHYLAKLAKIYNLDSLNFMMREGAIFEKYFKLLYPEIKTNLIYASRASTNFLDIDTNDIGSINMKKYRALTIQDLYQNFYLQIKHKTIKKYKLTLFEETNNIRIGNINLHKLIIEDLQSQKEIIVHNLKEQYTLLKQYLENKKIKKSSAFIDFGGRGQTNKKLINTFFNASKTKSILLFKYLEGYKATNIMEFSFLPYSKNSIGYTQGIARAPELIEILLNQQHETTLSYLKKENKATPKTYLPKCNTKTMPIIVKAFDLGIKAFFNIATHNRLTHKCYSRSFLTKLLARIPIYPTLNEALMLGDLEYDEGNTTKNLYKLIDSSQLDKIKQQGVDKFYKDFLKSSSAYKYKIPWTEGAITQIKPNFFDLQYQKNESHLQKQLQSIIDEIEAKKLKKILIYGAGDFFLQLLPSLQHRNVIIDKVIDKRAQVQSFCVETFQVTTLQKALKESKTKHIVICSSAFKKEIEKNIEKVCQKMKRKIYIING